MERVLHRFTGSDGANPQAALIDVNGTLYGTTVSGGKYGNGTVYRMNPTGRGRVLYSFKGKPDGANPLFGSPRRERHTLRHHAKWGLVQTAVPFIAYAPPARSMCFITFLAANYDGLYPDAGLIYVNGILYGTTFNGGSSGRGTVYSMSTTCTETVLYLALRAAPTARTRVQA